jgi:hypothetical protein
MKRDDITGGTYSMRDMHTKFDSEILQGSDNFRGTRHENMRIILKCTLGKIRRWM